MIKYFSNKIISFLLLATLLVPFSLQFIHAFETHNNQSKKNDSLDYIQKSSKNCAIYHQQINHNAIDFNLDFKLKLPVFITAEYLLIDSKIIQTYTNLKSSRAPPISFI